MSDRIVRRFADPLAELQPAPTTAPGRAPLTARMVPRPQIVLRVASVEVARELAGALGPRDANGVAVDAEAAVDRAASSSGAPLPGGVRDRFEASLGADLSAVRVHTGAASAEAASAVGARAYTVGSDIHFAAGQYAPEDPFGLHLLAHEVAHTQQQAGGAATRQHKLEVSTPGDAAEVEADRAADAMVAGATASVGSGGGVQREEAPATAPATGTPAASGTPAAAATTVPTSWRINFEDQFNGDGKKPTARTPGDAMFVSEFKIQAEGEAGKPPPAPKIFSGVTTAKTGASQVGTYDHPKDRGGKASAAVGYGKVPAFDFTLTTNDAKDTSKTAQDARAAAAPGAQHKAIIDELTKQLPDFVNEADAQKALQQIVATRFPGVDATATFKMTGGAAKAPVNTSDLNYNKLTAAKTFNTKVVVPTVTKDGTAVYTTTERQKDEKNRSSEQSRTSQTTDESSKETQLTTQITTAWKTALTTSLDSLLKESELTESQSKASSQLQLGGGVTGNLKSDITSSGELALPEALAKLLKAGLSTVISTGLGANFTLQKTWASEDAKKEAREKLQEIKRQLAAAIEATGSSMATSSLREQVRKNVTVTESAAAKEDEKRARERENGSTQTQGTIRIVASSLKPVLVEE